MQQQDHVFTIEVEEIKVFIGITAFMEYHIVLTLHDYWNQDPGFALTVVANVMSRDRFLEVRRALQLVNTIINIAEKKPLADICMTLLADICMN